MQHRYVAEAFKANPSSLLSLEDDSAWQTL